MDPQIVAAIIGVIGVIIGVVIGSVSTYYFQQRAERKKRKERSWLVKDDITGVEYLIETPIGAPPAPMPRQKPMDKDVRPPPGQKSD